MTDPVAEYHRLLEADPAAAREQALALREAFLSQGVTFDGQPMPSFVRPHFVARSDWDALVSQGTRVMEIAARVARDVDSADMAGVSMAWLLIPALCLAALGLSVPVGRSLSG